MVGVNKRRLYKMVSVKVTYRIQTIKIKSELTQSVLNNDRRGVYETTLRDSQGI